MLAELRTLIHTGHGPNRRPSLSEPFVAKPASVRENKRRQLPAQPAAGGSDLEANGLDRLGASLHGLAFCSSKPGAHEAGDHVAIKPMGAHKQCFSRAMRAAGE
jgi:hypothetical protein